MKGARALDDACLKPAHDRVFEEAEMFVRESKLGRIAGVLPCEMYLVLESSGMAEVEIVRAERMFAGREHVDILLAILVGDGNIDLFGNLRNDGLFLLMTLHRPLP